MHSQGQDRLKVPVKIKVEDGDLEGVSVVLRNNTTGETEQIPGASRLDLELNLASDYVISFSKQGYITKKIALNTRVPELRASQGFYPFNFEVVLFPQYEGVNIVVFNQPVGKIFFDRILDDFGYDTDYTKQIQSELKKAEEEIIKKQKEQHELAVQQKKEADKKKAEDEKIAKEQARIQEAERKKAEEEVRKAAILEAKRLKAEQDSLRLASRSASGSSGVLRANAEGGSDSRNSSVGAGDGDLRPSSGGTGGSDSRGSNMDAGSGQDASNRAQSGSGADGKDNQLTNGAGSDMKSGTEAGNTSGMDHGKTTAEIKTGKDVQDVRSPLSPVPSNVQIESAEHEENGKKILKVVVRNGTSEIVFQRITFGWGDVVYYKSGKYITGAYFFSQTGFR